MTQVILLQLADIAIAPAIRLLKCSSLINIERKYKSGFGMVHGSPKACFKN